MKILLKVNKSLLIIQPILTQKKAAMLFFFKVPLKPAFLTNKYNNISY